MWTDEFMLLNRIKNNKYHKDILGCKVANLNLVDGEPVEVINHEPITLTEEILRLSGAIKIDPYFEYDRFMLIFQEDYDYWKINDKATGCYFTKVEFVHEWQNFVWIMNGEHLTFEHPLRKACEFCDSDTVEIKDRKGEDNLNCDYDSQPDCKITEIEYKCTTCCETWWGKC